MYIQAKAETAVLKNVHELVESHYVGGRPRHHLPSARNPELTPGCSVFFIIDFVEFMSMPAPVIHRIARHRHIVVQNVPQDDFSWSRASLSRLGHLSSLREIQGKCLRSSWLCLCTDFHSSSWPMPW
jgi:hypothetical protein